MTSRRPRRPRGPRTCLVTTGVVQDTPVFADPVCCDILLRTTRSCQQTYGFEVPAYVILPSRFLWIVHLGRGRPTVSDVMRDLKRQSAWEIMTYLEKEHSYDTLQVFIRSARNVEDQRRRFWRPHFDETVIGDLESLRRRIDEILGEPVREGLAARPSDYRYSSAGIHLLGEHAVLTVTPLSELEWIA